MTTLVTCLDDKMFRDPDDFSVFMFYFWFKFGDVVWLEVVRGVSGRGLVFCDLMWCDVPVL